MSYRSESDLSAYAVQTLEALEATGQSLIDRCKDLRQNTARIQPEELENLVLSAISAIQSVWNTISPIHRLPSEVLVHVFSLVPQRCPISETDAQRGHWPFTFPDININFQLATVCKHWRNLINETPALWSVVSETGATYLHLPNMWTLARCPRGPLFVYVSGRVFPRMWSLLKSEGHRVQQLHMTNVAAGEEAILALLQSFPATQLEHCKIGISIPEHKRKRLLSLFSGDGRSLRSLYLDKVPFLPSNKFPRLTCLILDRSRSHDDPHWDLGDLIQFLAGCPRLEHLQLSHVWRRNGPYGPNVSTDASRVVFPHMHTFTLDLDRRLLPATMQMILSVVELPRTCQVQLRRVRLNELQAISPSLLSLGRPLTRMRLTLGAAFHDYTGIPRWDWSLVLASHQPDCAAIRLVLESAHTTQDPTIIAPNFSTLPLFEDVEELWYRSDLLDEKLLGRIPLPPKVRGLALSILSWIPSFTPSYLAQVARVGGKLDTLCICVPNAEHLYHVRKALTSLEPNGRPRCRAIRRVAVGYDRPSARLSRGAISLQDCGAGTEFSWTGQIAKRSEGDTEIDRLLSVTPQVLEEPANICATWPTWSGFVSD